MMKCITLPTSRGGYSARCVQAPELYTYFDACVSVWRVWPCGSGASKELVRLMMTFEDFETSEEEPSVMLACVPHVLRDHIDCPSMVPVLQSGYIDVEKWLCLRLGKPQATTVMAELLDGGKANYRRLCRGDVLRVLLDHYDREGRGSRIKESDILTSQFRRRFYEPELVNSVLADLIAEGLACGPNREFWIEPKKHKEARAEVEGIDRELLSASQSAPVKAFAAGQRFTAWEELRQIIKSSTKYVWLEDAWLGGDVVALLGGNLQEGVSVRFLGPDKANSAWDGALTSLKRLGDDRPGRIEVRCSPEVHDRYVYSDGKAWRCTDSFKDMARKRTTKLVAEAEPDQACRDFENRWAKGRAAYPI
jgi:hypothetical protein